MCLQASLFWCHVFPTSRPRLQCFLDLPLHVMDLEHHEITGTAMYKTVFLLNPVVVCTYVWLYTTHTKTLREILIRFLKCCLIFFMFKTYIIFCWTLNTCVRNRLKVGDVKNLLFFTIPKEFLWTVYFSVKKLKLSISYTYV